MGIRGTIHSPRIIASAQSYQPYHSTAIKPTLFTDSLIDFREARSVKLSVPNASKLRRFSLLAGPCTQSCPSQFPLGLYLNLRAYLVVWICLPIRISHHSNQPFLFLLCGILTPNKYINNVPFSYRYAT